ncbi:MAG: hypothetical protein IJG33_16835 [Selenomonadaceae bacterium]|nr:hypothetical protein [Selenomonadaceae bacterium]
MVARIEAQMEDKTKEEKEAEARAIRKRMKEDQKRLDELTGAGGDFAS